MADEYEREAATAAAIAEQAPVEGDGQDGPPQPPL